MHFKQLQAGMAIRLLVMQVRVCHTIVNLRHQKNLVFKDF